MFSIVPHINSIRQKKGRKGLTIDREFDLIEKICIK